MTSCFIITPISTPEQHVAQYGGDDDHFTHVLECLFIPAIEKAGMEAIPPNVKGANLIHAEIIKNLETADLVLCDMSLLNPNVFFELGIRTALSKPVSLVVDDITDSIPFDMHIVNHHKYNCSIPTWIIEKEIQDLADHLKSSLSSEPEKNALWAHFSMSLRAKPADDKTGVEGKVDYLNAQFEALRQQIDAVSPVSKRSDAVLTSDEMDEIRFHHHRILEDINRLLEPDARVTASTFNNDVLTLELSNPPPKSVMKELYLLAEHEGMDLRFEQPPQTKGGKWGQS